MNDFDTEVAKIGRQRAIAFFAPRLAALAIVAVLLAVLLAGCSMKDDTDPPSGASGMDLRQDNATGCQYLSRGNALIPRVAADGKSHMGCKAVQP